MQRVNERRSPALDDDAVSRDEGNTIACRPTDPFRPEPRGEGFWWEGDEIDVESGLDCLQNGGFASSLDNDDLGFERLNASLEGVEARYDRPRRFAGSDDDTQFFRDVDLSGTSGQRAILLRASRGSNIDGRAVPLGKFCGFSQGSYVRRR
jgi:hypothetical protein